jgi:hypothetical protein
MTTYTLGCGFTLLPWDVAQLDNLALESLLFYGLMTIYLRIMTAQLERAIH